MGIYYRLRARGQWRVPTFRRYVGGTERGVVLLSYGGVRPKERHETGQSHRLKEWAQVAQVTKSKYIGLVMLVVVGSYFLAKAFFFITS